MRLTRPLTYAAAAVLAAFTAGSAIAESNYPTQPIRVLVPYVPGGATDYAARLVSEKAKEFLGGTIVIDNKAGAGGLLALEELARAKPDGYTLMIGNVSTNSITPILFRKRMSFEYLDKVLPIARLLITPSVFIANANFPANNWKEFIDYAKANPGKLRAASTGIGAFTHFDLEMLQQKTGIKLIHVPYREGAGGAIQALVNGDVNVGSTNAVQAHNLRGSGKIKLYATNMTERIKTLPDVPTFTELGLPGHGTMNWSGVFAPVGTPPEVVKKLNEAFTKAANDPWVIEKAANSATFKFPTATQEEFVAFVKSEMDKWRKVAEDVKIEMN